MGNCNCSTNIDLNKRDSAGAYTFELALGQGGFGKVWKVTHKKTKEQYAMKVMKKNKILTKKSVSSILNERKILSEVQNQFIINMTLAFQDKDSLYLVLEYMNGGDMRYHINRGVEYTEEQTKFIACSIIAGLSAIHKNNIIHRDLKPENIVFAADGYLKITDFGIARYYRPDNGDQTSGTPGYMAPEVLLKQPHGFIVDYYALGVILFEIIYGERPYLGKNRKDIKDKIIKEQRKLRQSDLPDETWSLESADFVNKLIQRNPSNRLGYKGIEQVIHHPWIIDFDWSSLFSKSMPSPFTPILEPGESGGSFVNSKQNQEEDEKDKQNQQLLKRNSVQQMFAPFDFDPLGILSHNKNNADDEEEQKNQVTPPMTSTQTQYNTSRDLSQIDLMSSSASPKKKPKVKSKQPEQIEEIKETEEKQDQLHEKLLEKKVEQINQNYDGEQIQAGGVQSIHEDEVPFCNREIHSRQGRISKQSQLSHVYAQSQAREHSVDDNQ